jgi:hypothetical protein
MPPGIGAVDSDGARRLGFAPPPHVLASPTLVVGSDGVLEVQHDLVGSACQGLGEAVRPITGHEQHAARRGDSVEEL